MMAISSHSPLPHTHKAPIIASHAEPPRIQTLPTLQPEPGSAVVRIQAANVISYMRDIYDGKRQYPYPMPLIAGTSAVGRFAAAGPDATLWKAGDLVHVDYTIRGNSPIQAAAKSRGVFCGCSLRWYALIDS